MSLTRLLLLMFAVGAGLTLIAGCSDSAQTRPAVANAYTDPIRTDPAPPPEAIEKIRSAATPSDAVAQYSSAIAAGVDPLPLERAYVSKMVVFGLPEMAEAQAADLARRDPTDGVAWGVMAFMNARRDDNDSALKQINTAAKNAPDDPFVQRTAGQLLAWYDSQPDHMLVSSDAQKAAFDARERLHERTAFAQAYRDAWDDAHPNDQAFGPATAPTTSPYAEMVPATNPTTQQALPEAGVYDSGLPPAPQMYSPPYYTDPYAYRGDYDYQPWWPSTYYGLGFGYGYGFYRPLYRYPFYDYRFHNYHVPSHEFFDHRFDRHFEGDHFIGRRDGRRIHDSPKLHDDQRGRVQDRRITPTNPPPSRVTQPPRQQQQGPSQQRSQQPPQQRSSTPPARSAPHTSSGSHEDRGGRSR